MQPKESPTVQTMKHFDQDGSLSAENLTGTLLQGADGIVLSCDPAAEQLLGYSARQLVGTTAFDPAWQTIHPDESPFLPEHYPAIVALRSGKPCRHVVMGFYRPNGYLVWLCLNSMPLFQPDIETPVAVVTTFSEVLKSEVLKSEVLKPTIAWQESEERLRLSWNALESLQLVAELQASETRFRNMADNAPMMVWVTDPLGYCTYLSQSWYDFTGQTEATGSGLGWLDAIHPDDRAPSEAIFLAANELQEAFQLEYRLCRQDGQYRTCIDAAKPWFGTDGTFKGYIGSVIDIDDRIQIEAALRHSEERYRTLFEAIDEGFCVVEVMVDPNNIPTDYRVLEVNPVFEQQTGILQAVGKTARQLNLEEHWIEIYGRVALTGASIRFESSSEVLGRWFDVYACRTGEPEARKVAIIFKDISDRKRAEAEREQLLQREQTAREAAENANRLKDEFLAVLSHELRSPLNPILGWSKLLQQRKLDTARTKTALITIERNAQLQAQLIDDLLDISRILRGKLSLNQRVVDLNFVISSALETVRLAAEAKSLYIQTISSPHVGTVIGDAGRLQQVVGNLLSNAVKFTSPGGQITVTLTSLPPYAQIQVMDTGKGIHPDFLPHVFEHFRQEDGATTRKFGGLGLGLAIARQIVELHGGTIAVESLGEDQGATFTVQIPIALQQSELATVETSLDSMGDLSGIRILVVDDEPDSREIVAFVLEQAGAIVTSVSSGIGALQALEQFIPDLIVSDIGMPEMDGYMLLQQIRSLDSRNGSIEQGRQIPAIALTAYAGEYDRQQALQAGFHQHLSKPIEPNKLIESIVNLMRKVTPLEPMPENKTA